MSHAVVHLPPQPYVVVVGQNHTTQPAPTSTEIEYRGECPMPTCHLTASWITRYYTNSNRTIWIWHCTECGNGQSAT